MTYKTLLKQAQEYFSNAATAEYVIQSLTNKKRYELYTDNSPVSEEFVLKFHNLLSGLNTAMPVQYLLHKAYFLSCELYVDERVMIPRFETEDLIMKTANKLRAQSPAPKAILDIGTGSGAIVIALADLFTQAKIIATDISADALEVARINLKKYDFDARIKLCPVDLFPVTNDKFDLIISNPPYIPHDEIESLSPRVKNYEPRVALDGGKDGLEIIERIIKQAPSYLSQEGLVALEIDPRQVDLIKDLSLNAQFEKDNQGLIRYAFIKF